MSTSLLDTICFKPTLSKSQAGTPKKGYIYYIFDRSSSAESIFTNYYYCARHYITTTTTINFIINFLLAITKVLSHPPSLL